MRKLLVVALLVAVASTGCTDLFDPAAAVVGSQKISVDEINGALEDFVETQAYDQATAQGDPNRVKREFEQAFLSQEIREAVIAPEAEERGIEVVDEEVAQRMEEIEDDFPSRGAFEEALKEQGLTLDQLQDLVEQSIVEEKLRAEITEEAGPTSEDLREYFDENIDEFSEARVQHILVEERAVARRIAQQLQDTPEAQLEDRFSSLAARFSADQSNADRGGDLGYVSRRSGLAEPFIAAVEDLGLNQISDPVETQFGYHVIWVTDRRVPEFEDVEAEIAQQLGAQNEDRVWAEWLREAYQRADIKVNSRYGELDVDTQQVIDPSAETIPGAEEDAPGSTPTPAP